MGGGCALASTGFRFAVPPSRGNTGIDGEQPHWRFNGKPFRQNGMTQHSRQCLCHRPPLNPQEHRTIVPTTPARANTTDQHPVIPFGHPTQPKKPRHSETHAATYTTRTTRPNGTQNPQGHRTNAPVIPFGHPTQPKKPRLSETHAATDTTRTAQPNGTPHPQEHRTNGPVIPFGHHTQPKKPRHSETHAATYTTRTTRPNGTPHPQGHHINAPVIPFGHPTQPKKPRLSETHAATDTTRTTRPNGTPHPQEHRTNGRKKTSFSAKTPLKN